MFNIVPLFCHKKSDPDEGEAGKFRKGGGTGGVTAARSQPEMSRKRTRAAVASLDRRDARPPAEGEAAPPHDWRTRTRGRPRRSDAGAAAHDEQQPAEAVTGSQDPTQLPEAEPLQPQAAGSQAVTLPPALAVQMAAALPHIFAELKTELKTLVTEAVNELKDSEPVETSWSLSSSVVSQVRKSKPPVTGRCL